VKSADECLANAVRCEMMAMATRSKRALEALDALAKHWRKLAEAARRHEAIENRQGVSRRDES
jgi:hypothetical protein